MDSTVFGTLERKVTFEDTWLDRSELQKINPDLLEYYESSSTPDSTESSSLPPRENDEGMASTRPKRRYDHVYQRRRCRATSIWS